MYQDFMPRGEEEKKIVDRRYSRRTVETMRFSLERNRVVVPYALFSSIDSPPPYVALKLAAKLSSNLQVWLGVFCSHIDASFLSFLWEVLLEMKRYPTGC